MLDKSTKMLDQSLKDALDKMKMGKFEEPQFFKSMVMTANKLR